MSRVRVWRSPKVEIRASAYGGRAVYAAEPIEAGELVAVKAGHPVDTTEVLQITSELGDYSLQIDDDLFLTPRHTDEYEELVVHISHSCDPNVGFSGQVTYVAMRDIDAGEELSHDYAMARSATYALECGCGTDLCRRVVTHNDWKRADLQQRYKGYFQPYLARRIAAG